MHESNVAHYHPWVDDGADVKCAECHAYGRKGLVLVCTPDGRRCVVHFACLDEAWVAKFARKVGPLAGDFSCREIR
jgi:hypothetical protein